MLGKANSPTARLLRSSRLFSLPPQLPKPSLDKETPGGDASLIRGSDSATLPYPVNQAIATPQSSQARGDWGLKRPLPLRTTAKSSNAALRITNIDSIEHITDFESAADHTKTLEKWQEIGLPVTQHARRQTVSDARSGYPLSVFESEIDNTSKPPDRGLASSQVHQRWKFEGPSIPGMSDGAFSKYVTTVGKHKKSQFLRYLREHIRRAEVKAERSRMVDEGQDLPTDFQDTYTISEEFFQDKLKRMRDDMTDRNGKIKLNSELSKRMREFFDFPHFPEETASTLWSRTTEDTTHKAPAKTHPSAGFSYLRTQAHIPNHPLLGPQRTKPVVRIRLLRAQNNMDDRAGSLGVAGVVVKTNQDPHSFGLERDFNVHGGPKAWATIERLSIDTEGRIETAVTPPDPDAVDIKEGRLPQRVEQPDLPYKKLTGAQPLDVSLKGPRGRSGYYNRMGDNNPVNHTGDNDSVDHVKRLLTEHLWTQDRREKRDPTTGDMAGPPRR